MTVAEVDFSLMSVGDIVSHALLHETNMEVEEKLSFHLANKFFGDFAKLPGVFKLLDLFVMRYLIEVKPEFFITHPDSSEAELMQVLSAVQE